MTPSATPQIQFVVRADKKVGTGHLVRTLTVARSLADQPVDIHVAAVASGEITKFFVRADDPIEIFDDFRSLQRYLSREKSGLSILCFDKPLIEDKEVVWARRLGAQKVGTLDGEAAIPTMDFVFDSEPKMRAEEICQQTFRGTKYRILADRTLEKRPEVSWNAQRVERVLVCFGGSDPDKLTESLIEQLRVGEKAGDELWDIVLGPSVSPSRADKLHSRVANCEPLRKVQLTHTTSEMAEKMLEAGAVVSIGGSVAFEAMCLGRPVLLVQWAHLADHCHRLIDAGLAVDAGTVQTTASRIRERLENPGLLREVAHRAWGQIDGRGASRTAEELCRMIPKRGG